MKHQLSRRVVAGFSVAGLAAMCLTFGAQPRAATGSVTPFVADLGVRAVGAPRAATRAASSDPCTHYKKQRMYIGVFYEENYQNISVMRTSGNGSVPPLCTIQFSGIGETQGLALDAGGRLWQSSYFTKTETDSLYVYAPNANGKVTPVQTISGSNTGLSGQSTGEYQQMGIDSQGTVWVPNRNGNGGYITAYANDANGNVSPIATIGVHDNGAGAHLAAPTSIAFDKSGNMFVANLTAPGTIDVFQPPFTDDSTPIATWVNPGPGQYDESIYLAFDRRGNLYTAGQFNIDMYPKGLQSNGVPSIELNQLDFVPVAIFGLATDKQNRVYVVNQEGFLIDVLPPEPTTYMPIRVIAGSTWGNWPPETIAIGD
jgi:hypothetical protein